MDRYVLMKIGVESTTNPIFGAGEVEYYAVFSGCHSDFANMNRIKATFPKQCGCTAGQSLIQKEPGRDGLHATSNVVTVSSRLAAEKASACLISSSSNSGYSLKNSPRSGRVARARSTRFTVTLIPRIQGCPFICCGLTVIRSKGGSSRMGTLYPEADRRTP